MYPFRTEKMYPFRTGNNASDEKTKLSGIFLSRQEIVKENKQKRRSI